MSDDGSKQSEKVWPLPKFHFQAKIGDSAASFQEVSGLDVENDPIEYRAGDSKVFSTIKMPGMMKNGNITMKKGVFAKDNAIALRDELIKQEITILNSRIETYPRDSKLKFDLAKLLCQIKQHEKAIPLLQKASADQRLTADVGVLLGKCFIAVKKHTLAVSSLSKAIPAINTHDRPELFCDAHYLLGQLMEAKKDYAKAEEHFNEVIGIDYEYRDALQRLEKLQARSEQESAE